MFKYIQKYTLSFLQAVLFLGKTAMLLSAWSTGESVDNAASTGFTE